MPCRANARFRRRSGFQLLPLFYNISYNMGTMRLLRDRGIITIYCPSCKDKLFDVHYENIEKEAGIDGSGESVITAECGRCGFVGKLLITPSFKAEDGGDVQDQVNIVIAAKNKSRFSDGLSCPIDRAVLDKRAIGEWNEVYECHDCGAMSAVEIMA